MRFADFLCDFLRDWDFFLRDWDFFLRDWDFCFLDFFGLKKSVRVLVLGERVRRGGEGGGGSAQQLGHPAAPHAALQPQGIAAHPLCRG